MKVWILQTGEPLPIDDSSDRPMRAMNLSRALTEAGHDVVVWSSLFSHQQKKHRANFSKVIVVNDRLTIKLIPSRGYKRNIGLSRLIDHAEMALRLKVWLKKEELEAPDIAFVGYPPIETAFVMMGWLRKKSIPTILDIKDFWPQLFVESAPKALQPIVRVLFHPYFYLAKSTISKSNGLSSMTKSFLDYAKHFVKPASFEGEYILPLTQPIIEITEKQSKDAYQWWLEQGLDLSHSRRLIFVGSLSRSFDFYPISKALRRLNEIGIAVELVIAGLGEQREKIIEMFEGLPNVYFPGWVSTSQIDVLARNSLAAIAPYKNWENFQRNFPNKIVDNLRFGLPVISSLNGEVNNAIKNHGIGISCDETPESWAAAIEKLFNDETERLRLSRNARVLYSQTFAFDVVYKQFVRQMEELVEAQSPSLAR